MKLSQILLDDKNRDKLTKLNNPYIEEIISKTAELCNPAKITILTDSEKDMEYVRALAIKNGEEKPLATPGHTYHFDGPFDQGRDKEQTKVLLPKGETIGKHINTGDRQTCLAEIYTFLKDAMKGKEMLVSFYCLGPNHSRFSLLCLQITDSAYVVHSENLLYRPGYEQFKTLKDKKDFFHFIHSAGELANTNEGEANGIFSSLQTEYSNQSIKQEQNNSIPEKTATNNAISKPAILADKKNTIARLQFSPISKNVDKKRIYIDLSENRVFSVNTQYAGNSVGLKKLALRLAIKKSSTSDWLCEHMLIIGAKPVNKNRVTYFTGAFPSACGKTSTAMISGQTIVGDDIAYIKAGEDGKPYSVNVEKGIFGIISDINPKDDPVIYKVLTEKRELIFSNVLIAENNPYWLGMGRELPEKGLNYSGEWFSGKSDAQGNEIKAAHPNARYTLQISDLPNADPNLENPEGVLVSGIIYGGRDTDTSPPVVESFNWSHGVFMGSGIESETTAAVIGKTGVRMHNPMANLDFMVVPLPLYIENHLKFGANLKHLPLIFTVNYFQKENGQFLTDKLDKKVWLLWMEGRVHHEYEAIETPIGYIPRFEDLNNLFREVFRREYTKEQYDVQFRIRTEKLLEKLDRIETIFRQEKGIPEMIFTLIEHQRKRLHEAQKKFENSLISPFAFV